ncbi:MAG: iron ABC transporter permease [Candidatus Marinimicrobia bacterium]|nr:iron ABC transporter permease [Candidatus Neomarinimicrobiota bacterium]MBT4068806.1 iron ABC transporter permease [Candidatus Neomarinimicrobiota bacterium]
MVNRPQLVLGTLCLVILSFLVLTPLLEIIKDSLSIQSYDIAYLPNAKIGDFSLFHFERVFSGPLSKALLINPLLNSIAIGICVTLIGVSIGTIFAWLIVRTNIRFKGIFGALAVVPYMMPSWVLALAWLSLFKNDRIGGAEGMITYFFGIQPPNWISYGFFPIVICLSLHYYAYGYLLMSGALASVDSELEDAGAICGMNRRQRMWRITVPLLLPALGSAIVLTFIRILGTFGTPALLGLPVRFYTFSTQIYASLNASNNGDAYVLALVLIVTAITCIWVNNRVLGVRKSFVTLTGKGFRSREIDLGAWRWLATIGVALFLAFTVFLPLMILLWESLLIIPGDYNLTNFTLEYWIGDGTIDETYGEPGVFQSDNILSSLWNSIKLGLSAALFNGIIGLLVGYAVVRGRGTILSKWLEGIAFAPYIFPSIAFGAIYIGMFSTSWGPVPALYGTFTILVLITVVKNLPFTSRTGIAAMLQIDKSLEETARVQGIGWLKRMVLIVIPLSFNGLVSGMLLTFITAMRELSLIILLISPSNMVLTGLLFNYNEQDMTQHAGAVTLLLTFIIISGSILARTISGGFGLSTLKNG